MQVDGDAVKRQIHHHLPVGTRHDGEVHGNVGRFGSMLVT